MVLYGNKKGKFYVSLFFCAFSQWGYKFYSIKCQSNISIYISNDDVRKLAPLVHVTDVWKKQRLRFTAHNIADNSSKCTAYFSAVILCPT